MRIPVFHKVHLRIARVVEMRIGMEIVIGIDVRNLPAPALHALEEQKIARHMLVNQV